MFKIGDIVILNDHNDSKMNYNAKGREFRIIRLASNGWVKAYGVNYKKDNYGTMWELRIKDLSLLRSLSKLEIEIQDLQTMGYRE